MAYYCTFILKPMALTLFLLRHAKTQPAASGEADFDRPLYKEGVSQSNFLGAKLAENKTRPEYLLSSPAIRARETTFNVVRALGIGEHEIHFEPIIYNGDTSDLLELIQGTDNRYSSLLITGHNPPITSLASYLVRSVRESMNPCDWLEIEFELTDWSLLHKHSGTIKNFIPGASF